MHTIVIETQWMDEGQEPMGLTTFTINLGEYDSQDQEHLVNTNFDDEELIIEVIKDYLEQASKGFIGYHRYISHEISDVIDLVPSNFLNAVCRKRVANSIAKKF